MEEDFAATTTIGERVVPAVAVRERKTTTGAQGPSFGVPAKLEVSSNAVQLSAATLVKFLLLRCYMLELLRQQAADARSSLTACSPSPSWPSLPVAPLLQPS